MIKIKLKTKIIEEINEKKRWFFEKINKLKPQLNSSKKEKTQIITMRNEREDITADPTDSN